jgi:predicted RNase H-like HicB family nuclease
MLTDYIQQAMRRAHYEVMENGRFFGSIPECRGAWGEDVTLEECREELEGAFEAWLIAALRHGDLLPVLDGFDLNVKEHAEPNPAARIGL